MFTLTGFSLVIIASSVSASPLVKRQSMHSEQNVPMTYYGSDYFPTGDGRWTGDVPPYQPFGTGACGQEPVDKSLFVAMNAAAYSKGVCGMCAKVTYNGACVVAPIVDLCPGCGGGSSGLDLSLQGFGRLVGGEAEAKRIGVARVNFEILACPRGVHATGTSVFADTDPCSGSAARGQSNPPPAPSPNPETKNEPTATSPAAPATTSHAHADSPQPSPSPRPVSSPLPNSFEAQVFTCDSNNSLFGFPCCKNPAAVGDKYKDKNGFPWGFEDGVSCIVPKVNTTLTGTPAKDATHGLDVTKCGDDGFLVGFPCCKFPEKVTDEYKDSKGFRYGFENQKSCIVPLPKASS